MHIYTCMKVKVAQSCPTLCDPMDYIVRGILQARILECVAFPFSRGSSQARDWTHVSHFARGFFTNWATICIYMCVCVCVCACIYTHMLFLFSHSVASTFLWTRGLQYSRPPFPSPSPRVCPNSCSLHWWCHPAISFSDAFFSFCPQYFPASRTFPMSQLFASDDQNTGVSASVSSFQWVFRVDFP